MTDSKGAFASVDPAPPAPEEDVPGLRTRLLDRSLPMFQRMRAVFSLRSLSTGPAIEAICEAMLVDDSALLRHECAFVLGQLQDRRAIPALKESIRKDANPMVRHEACEALGNMGTEEIVPLLEHYKLHDPSFEVRQSCEVALDNIAYLKDPTDF
ncbi:MAG: HEAT repeat domain-containing protein [Euryarchaeota archaeon]|nr:HEAT repeat domain-containing protein [Euryarchaeota archaeon]